MDIVVSNKASRPLYEQISTQIKAAIMSGELKTGEAIPSVRSLAKSLHISILTVQKAYATLQEDGFIESTAGKGCYVSAQNQDFYLEEQQKKIEEHFTDAIEVARASGISLDKLINLLTLLYQEDEKMSENILEVKGLTKDYGDFVLDKLTFTVPKGVIMGLIGENGAGKSTTINCILNEISKTDGNIEIFGKDYLSEEIEIKDKIGVVFDENHFPDIFTPNEIGTYMSGIYSKWERNTYVNYLSKFELPADKRVKDFSKGMKVKLAFAVALSHKAELLILDEATSGLDPIIRDDILDILIDFVQDENHSVLVSSHIISDLEKVADYITFIHKGKLVFTHSKDELVDNYGVMSCGAMVFDNLDKSEIIAYRKEDYQYKVLVKDRHIAEKKYPKAIVVPAAIEEIMLFYVKGEMK